MLGNHSMDRNSAADMFSFFDILSNVKEPLHPVYDTDIRESSLNNPLVELYEIQSLSCFTSADSALV